jgi:CheY-like chemotaxis protein
MSAPRPRRVAVLVVDDDLEIRETVAGILEDEGHSVATASDGANALTVLETVDPELILLDLNMPNMSGEQFRVAQRGDPRIADIPTVVMSAVDRMAQRVADLALAGALRKPVALRELLDVVRRHVKEPTIAS